MSKRGTTRPWKVTYRWDNGNTGTVAYADKDTAKFNADKIRRSAAHQDREVDVKVVDNRPVTEQNAEFQAVVASFRAGRKGTRYTSDLYPGWTIGVGISETRPPYLVAGPGQRLVDMTPAHTFDGAVATVVSAALNA